ncbi:MAG: outer membrane beta-barrel protein [Bacteroidota bacterium]
MTTTKQAISNYSLFRKSLILTILTGLYGFDSVSQTNFEKGYFVTNTNEKIDCVIKNTDWLYNPEEFLYKISLDDSLQVGTLSNVKEFGVYGVFKYVRASVKIDQSLRSNVLRKLSDDREPVFEDKTLFLKALIEGETSLYQFENNSVNRFFLVRGDSLFPQLVYKQYRRKDKIGTNNYFRQQLINEFKCSGLNYSYFERLDYEKSDLVKIFKKYFECNGKDYTIYKKKRSNTTFNLSLRPGITSHDMISNRPNGDLFRFELNNNLGYRVGLEAEVILPFNNDKWSITFEPTYRWYSIDDQKDEPLLNPPSMDISLEYASLEIPINLRYYLYLNPKFKFFLSAGPTTEILLKYNTLLLLNNGNTRSDIQERGGRIDFLGNLGLGFKYDDRVELEFRYQVREFAEQDTRSFNTEINYLTIIFGYRFIQF